MTIELIIWCVGVVSVLATTWIQDRRQRRDEAGEAATLRRTFKNRLELLKYTVEEQGREIERLRKDVEHGR